MFPIPQYVNIYCINWIFKAWILYLHIFLLKCITGNENMSSCLEIRRMNFTNIQTLTVASKWGLFYFFWLCFLFIYLFLILFFSFTILYWFCHISTWICHRYARVPHPEPSSLLPPRTIPLGHPSAPGPSIQYRASNLDWRLVSYMILYMFQCNSPKSFHPLPLPQSPKDCSIHQCLFCCLLYRVIVTIFLNSIYMR